MTDEPKKLPKPVDWDDLYPGKFMKAADLKGKPWTLKVTSVDTYELEGEKGATVKGVVTFDGAAKQLALNRINGICLRSMFGRKLANWEGKRVTIYPTTVKEAGAMQGDPCIRIMGSPDIPSDLDVVIQLPKRKPYTLTMKKTGAQKPAAEPREPGADG